MSRCSPSIRIPREDWAEIKKIQGEYGFSFNDAFRYWKRQKMGMPKWKEY